jgi:hypothetical protein
LRLDLFSRVTLIQFATFREFVHHPSGHLCAFTISYVPSSALIKKVIIRICQRRIESAIAPQASHSLSSNAGIKCDELTAVWAGDAHLSDSRRPQLVRTPQFKPNR